MSTGREVERNEPFRRRPREKRTGSGKEGPARSRGARRSRSRGEDLEENEVSGIPGDDEGEQKIALRKFEAHKLVELERWRRCQKMSLPRNEGGDQAMDGHRGLQRSHDGQCRRVLLRDTGKVWRAKGTRRGGENQWSNERANGDQRKMPKTKSMRQKRWHGSKRSIQGGRSSRRRSIKRKVVEKCEAQ